MTQNSALYDKLLTNVASGYFPENYISESILPVLTHTQTTGKLGKYGTQHLRIVTTVKGGKGKYRQVDSVTRDSATFNIEGHGLTDIVTKEDYKNVVDPFKAEEDVTKALQTLLWLEKEKGLADQLADTAVLTQNLTLAAGQRLDEYQAAGSDPITFFKNARAAVKSGCGAPPDTAIMSWEVANVLRFHPQMLDSLGFKYDRPGGLTDLELASAMLVKKVFIGDVSYESAVEGQASAFLPVWGDNIVFAVCPDKPAVGQVALGYTVRYDGEQPRKVYKQPLFNPPEANEILVDDSYDQLFSNVLAAYLLKDVLT